MQPGPQLQSYIAATVDFLETTDKEGSIERYRFIEQAKAQLLTIISNSRVDEIPAQLLSFITET